MANSIQILVHRHNAHFPTNTMSCILFAGARQQPPRDTIFMHLLIALALALPP